MSEIGMVVRYGRVYAIASLVNRASGLLLIPVYTYALTPAQFGLYALIQSISDLLAILFGLGFTGAMTRFYIEYQDDARQRNAVVSTALICVSAIAAAVLLVSHPLAGVAVAATGVEAGQRGLFTLAFASLATIVLFEFACSYAVARKLAWRYLWLSMGKACLLIALNLLLVLRQGMGVAGILWASIGCFGVLGVFGCAGILRESGASFSRKHFGELARFGLPLVPSAVANAALGVVERYFLNSLAGPAAVGVYSLAHRIAGLVQQFVALPFSQIFFVRRVESLVQGEGDEAHARVLLLFVLVMALASLALSAYAPEILALVAPGAYRDAAPLIPLLALSYVLASMNLNFEVGLYYNKATWVIPLIGVISLVACVPLNYFLVGSLGVTGAAVALLAVNILRICATLSFNAVHGSRRVRLEWPRAVAILVLGTLAGILFVERSSMAWHLPDLALKTLIFLAISLGAFFSPLLDRTSRLDVLALLGRGRG